MANKEYILQSIKERLKDVLPQEGKALLFGSQARGDERMDSDWDILILLAKNVSQWISTRQSIAGTPAA